MPLEFEQGRAGARVPDFRGLIPTPRNQTCPVRAERHAIDNRGMPVQAENAAVKLALEIVPFPAAHLRRNLLQSFASDGYVSTFIGGLSEEDFVEGQGIVFFSDCLLSPVLVLRG